MMRVYIATLMRGAVTPVGAALRLEWRYDSSKISAHSEEHGLNHMVRTNAQQRAANVCWQMPIAQVPRESHELFGIGVPDFDQALLGGLNPDPSAIFELQTVSIRHGDGSRKIQQDQFTIIQSEPNAPAMPRFKIKRDGSHCSVIWPLACGAMD